MNICDAIISIMSEIGSIEKTRKNTQGQGYNFRGIDDVLKALQPLLIKYAVFCVPVVLEAVREERQSKSGGLLIYTVLKVSYKFYSGDSSSVEAIVYGEAMDSGDKGIAKALSAAFKALAFQLFCIPTDEEKDTEYHSPEVLPKGNPIVPRIEPKQTNSGANSTALTGQSCDLCHGPLRESKKGGLYCPNFKDKSKGEHTFISAGQLLAQIHPPLEESHPELTENDIPF